MSKRKAAWRNMMVAAINSGIEQGLFGLGEDENHWEGKYAIYRFEINGIPAIASAVPIGYGELQIQVGLWPAEQADAWVAYVDAGFKVGEIVAWGYLERKLGKWLQVGTILRLKSRAGFVDRVAALRVKPKGYKDEGRFIC